MSSLIPSITMSVVSHGQASLVNQLLNDLDRSGAANFVKEVIVTRNIPENQDVEQHSASMMIFSNDIPRGFGENHNHALQQSSSDFFCVVNPDIRLDKNPFPALMKFIQSNNLGVVGPRVVNLHGEVEDNARPFPTPLKIIKKLFGNKAAGLYPTNSAPDSPDWIAGMFMLFDAKAFAEVGGFDERYFLYYEDADICARLRGAGWSVGYCKEAEVTHDARRDSHRKLRYLKWHLTSMLRFFMSSAYRLLRNRS